MSRKIALLLSSFLLINLGGCKKREKPPPIPRDVCALITLDEIQVIQGSPMKESKNSARADAGFRVSQCFYTATEFSKSVNLALVQRDPDHPTKRSARDFWKEKFSRYSGETEVASQDSKSERKEEKEESVRPKKIDSIGDQAFWVSNRFGGVLYVLKGDVFISIGLGGTDDEQTKLNKSKALAKTAVQRL